MKKNKGMQLGAMLAAMLLLSMAFVAAAGAQDVKDQTKVITPDGRYIINKSDIANSVISSGSITVPISNTTNPTEDEINERHNISRNIIMALTKELNVPDNETVTLGCDFKKGNCTYQIVKPVKGTSIASSTGSPTPASSFGGWAEDANYTSPPGTTSFRGVWQVPNAPQSQILQIINYFIALQPNSGTGIIQPVLQWGYSNSDYQYHWIIFSEYEDSTGHFSNGAQYIAYTGDTIKGYLEYQGNPTQWWIYTDDSTRGTESTNHLADSRVWNQNYVALEPYGVNSCSTYPGGADFTGLGINNAIPTWQPWVDPNAKSLCSSLGVTIVSSSEVKLNTGN